MTALRLAVPAALLVAAAAAAPARAGIIFSNREVAEYGTDNAAQIGPPNAVTQLFSLDQAGTPTAARVGIWVPDSGNQLGLQSVIYRLGTTQFGTDLGTATVPVTSTYLYTNTRGYAIFSAVFDLPSTSALAANTGYYFSLSNALSSPPDFTFWDNRDAGPVQSLTLFGDPAAVPEPASLGLLAAGGLGLLGYARPRRPTA